MLESCACLSAGSKDDLEDPSKSTLQDYLKRVNETQREGKSLMCPAADGAGPAEPMWQATTSAQLPSIGTCNRGPSLACLLACAVALAAPTKPAVRSCKALGMQVRLSSSIHWPVM